MARDFLAGLHATRVLQERVAHLVFHHMFRVRIELERRSGPPLHSEGRPSAVHDLPPCERPTTWGSGLPADSGNLPELALRIDAQLAASVVLGRGQLAVDGTT